MRRALLCAAGAALVIAAPGLAGSPRPFTTVRTVELPAGQTARAFTMREHRGVILVNRVTVRHGVHVVVTAQIPKVAGVRVRSWADRALPMLSCVRRGADDVCTEGEEWCPMPEATWHVRVVKLGGPAAMVRFTFVVAPPPS